MTGGSIKQGPVPQGKYSPAKRHGDLVYTSGMTPRVRGVLSIEGRVCSTKPLSDYKDAVILACSNALEAVHGELSDGEKVGEVLSLTAFIASNPEFQEHSQLADFASEFLLNELGHAGIGARAAVGVATLPGNAPIEIQLVATVSQANNVSNEQKHRPKRMGSGNGNRSPN